MRIDELIEELKKYPPHTDVVVTFPNEEADGGRMHERDIEVKPWNDWGFCVLIEAL